MNPPHLTPEESRQVERAHRLFDEYLQAHLIEDVKILVSTHTTLVLAALIGFIWVVALAYRLFLDAG